MSAGRRILFFIPMYQCAAQIGRVLARFDARARPFVTEILMVDNGSSDGTEQRAREALIASGLPGKVVRNEENYSLGGSHKVAFNYAIDNGFEAVVVVHGDDQADARDIVPHLENGAYLGYDSFLGSRFMRGSRRQGYSLFRTAANYGFNFLCGLLCGRAMSDQGSGLNLYAVSYLSTRFYLTFDNSLMFPNQMFFHGVYARSRYAFFPISWREEDQVSNARMWRQAYKVVRLIMSIRQTYATKDNALSRRDYRYKIIHQQS